MRTEEKETAIETKKVIDRNQEVAGYLEKAAKKHREAAAFHESGDHDKACDSLVKAHNHLALAAEVQTDMLKDYSFTS